MPGRSTKQCKEHWRNALDPTVKKSSWSGAEDQSLLEAHQQVGNKWSKIARLLPGRTQLQIRDRWRFLCGSRKVSNQSPRRSSVTFAESPTDKAASMPRKDDLTVLNLIGVGSFGRVRLVRQETTASYFALKCMNKV